MISPHPLEIGGEEILHEDPQRPAVRDGMVDGEDEHVIVRRTAEHHGPIERSGNEVEGSAENFLSEFLD